ncbi:hypothetical protein ACIGEP_06165 [Microbacterium sp. NPDC077663]|uniref:hypothetical protein n=1 Tax=Microbacterium sp. NPDC077663 TaxID=3364189 RepID=UPI0037C9376D
MPEKRGPKRKAWVIVYDDPRGPFRDSRYGVAEPGEPLAIFPSRTPIERIMAAVDALVQALTVTYVEDRIDYLKKDVYGRAEKHGWGQQVMGGTNPYIEAFRVEDLRLVTDTETGATRFEFTRQPPDAPRHLS